MFRASITASFRPARSGYWSIAVEVRFVIGEIGAAFDRERRRRFDLLCLLQLPGLEYHLQQHARAAGFATGPNQRQPAGAIAR